MMTEYYCTDLEKAIDYDDIRYYKLEDSKFNAVKKPGWYIRVIFPN